MSNIKRFRYTEIYVGLIDGSISREEITESLTEVANSYSRDMLKCLEAEDMVTFMTLLKASSSFEQKMNGLTSAMVIILTDEEIESRAKNIAKINDISMITARRLAKRRANRLANPYFIQTHSIANGYFIL